MSNFLSKLLLGGIMFSTAVISSATAATAIDLEKQADVIREQGHSIEAINIYEQAIVQYQADRNYSGMMGSLTGRLLARKHLFYATGDRIYAIFVKKETEAMLEIAQEHNLTDKMYLMHFLKGSAAILLEDYPLAEIEFRQSLELFPYDIAEKGDWMAHLGDAIYRNGRKEEGKELILQGVQRIQEKSSEIDPFRFDVWVSGAYLRLAKLLQDDNFQECQSFLYKAEEIINANDQLVIRKQQLEAFKQLIK